MHESFWQKIKKNHFLLMVLCCTAPIILVVGFLVLFKGGGSFAWLFILLCPVLHFWLMRGHKHNGDHA